jgi:DNA-binding LacI/PurR family transcriptional regulator
MSEAISAVQEKQKVVASHRKLPPELVVRDSTSALV